MTKLTYHLFDDRMVYAGTVDLDDAEPAPPLSTLDAPADPTKVGKYQRVDGAWTSYKAPKTGTYEPSPDPFAPTED